MITAAATAWAGALQQTAFIELQSQSISLAGTELFNYKNINLCSHVVTRGHTILVVCNFQFSYVKNVAIAYVITLKYVISADLLMYSAHYGRSGERPNRAKMATKL